MHIHKAVSYFQYNLVYFLSLHKLDKYFQLLYHYYQLT